MKATKIKALTIAEERERIEKIGTIRMDYMQADPDTIRVMPCNLKSALRPLNKAEDMVILPMLGIALPACYLKEFAPLMGDSPASLHVDHVSMQMIITYQATPDSKSRTTIKGTDAREWESENEWERPRMFTARVTCEYAPEPARLDAWIAKAVSKDHSRPQLRKSYGKFSADGWRIHYDRTLPLELPAPDFLGHDIPDQIEKMIHDAARVDNAALAPVPAFIAAMKQAQKANKNTVNLYVNGRLDISATTDEDSIIRNVVTDGYQHAGENVNILINPRFLLDALQGMRGEVIIGIGDPQESGGRRIYLSDGTREAVIMSKLEEE